MSASFCLGTEIEKRYPSPPSTLLKGRGEGYEGSGTPVSEQRYGHGPFRVSTGTTKMADTRENKENSIPLSGKKLGYTFNNRNFHNVSLGQGQEIVAEAALDLAAKKGHWVILQVRPLRHVQGHS